MSARILVVDDLAVNVRLLEAKLLAEYYDVVAAGDGPTALKLAGEKAPDLVLLDVMMPGLDGFEVCRRLKADPETAHIPVVMVTALDDPSDRVRGLEAGADDFLTKPVNDVALFARIRSLVRLKRAGDEWRSREATFLNLGVSATSALGRGADDGGNVLLVMDDDELSRRVAGDLAGRDHPVVTARSVDEAAQAARHAGFDLILIDDDLHSEDALRLCSRLRQEEGTRYTPIVLVVHGDEHDRLAKALELGVNDYLVRPVDRDEMFARVASQIRHKRYEDDLRENYRRCLTAALTDSLTGLNNRRYLEAHFDAVDAMLAEASKPLSLMVLDVDRFKSLNDSFGHAAGDVVLQGVAGRILTNLRGPDTAVRYGGEEFVVLMPDTAKAPALAAAERLCEAIGQAPFAVPGTSGEVQVTISIGVATDMAGRRTLDWLIVQADRAMYEAKRGGRSRVVVAGRDDPPETVLEAAGTA